MAKTTATTRSAKKTAGAESRKRLSKSAAAKVAHQDTDEPIIDRRSGSRRTGPDRRAQNVAVTTERRKLERREKVSRRRQIDPTTCEREYTDEELEFMSALDRYKRVSGRMFPTCSEILEVVKGLGYCKAAAADAPAAGQEPADSPEQVQDPAAL